jgi:hypothetical protein
MRRTAVVIVLLSLAASAEAYVGPGMGLGVLGAAFGFLAAIFLALAGMVWYPIKRLIRAKRVAAVSVAGTDERPSAEPPSR